MSDPPDDVTELLESISSGDRAGWQRLLSIVYQELHQLAHAQMRRERRGHTLQTTALIHEAYVRLVKDEDQRFRDRSHFFTAAASAMRRILVDAARTRKAAKRGGGREPGLLDAAGVGGEAARETHLDDVESLDAALRDFEAEPQHERKSRVVQLRFFAGLTLQQVAEVLDVSLVTVKRDWEFARAWLLRDMIRREGHAG